MSYKKSLRGPVFASLLLVHGLSPAYASSEGSVAAQPPYISEPSLQYDYLQDLRNYARDKLQRNDGGQLTLFSGLLSGLSVQLDSRIDRNSELELLVNISDPDSIGLGYREYTIGEGADALEQFSILTHYHPFGAERSDNLEIFYLNKEGTFRGTRYTYEMLPKSPDRIIMFNPPRFLNDSAPYSAIVHNHAPPPGWERKTIGIISDESGTLKAEGVYAGNTDDLLGQNLEIRGWSRSEAAGILRQIARILLVDGR
jgi:hypothetical protein